MQAEPRCAGGNLSPTRLQHSMPLMEAGTTDLETREEAVINSASGFGRSICICFLHCEFPGRTPPGSTEASLLRSQSPHLHSHQLPSPCPIKSKAAVLVRTDSLFRGLLCGRLMKHLDISTLGVPCLITTQMSSCLTVSCSQRNCWSREEGMLKPQKGKGRIPSVWGWGKEHAEDELSKGSFSRTTLQMFQGLKHLP